MFNIPKLVLVVLTSRQVESKHDLIFDVPLQNSRSSQQGETERKCTGSAVFSRAIARGIEYFTGKRSVIEARSELTAKPNCMDDEL